jgi:large subunit ribosomal protein L9
MSPRDEVGIMKVILTRAFEKLGQPGDIVDVKPGFARNYLFPNKIALTATKGNLKIFEEGKKRHKIQESKKVKKAQKVAEQLSKVSITATVAVGEEDKVFGSVTAQNIADLLNVAVSLSCAITSNGVNSGVIVCTIAKNDLNSDVMFGCHHH